MATRRVSMETFRRVSKCAEKTFRRVTLGDLMHHRRRMDRLGTPDAFLNVANWLHDELPVRFAKQLMDFYHLPYMVSVSEPFMEVHDLHLKTFQTLSTRQPVTSGREVEMYVGVLRQEFQSHLETIRLLREGLLELQSVIKPEDVQSLSLFMDQFLMTKIGSRVLAENFVNWFDRVKYGTQAIATSGVIQECKLAPYLRNVACGVSEVACQVYGSSPEIIFEDDYDVEVLVIPSHVEFIFQEVLKNAMCATMDSRNGHSGDIPPVRVAIRPGTYDVEIKVSDQGIGMKRRLLKKIWDYGFSGRSASSGVALQQDLSREGAQMSGYGIGIPLCRLFARYFGGDMTISSVYGFGTDVSIRLNRLGDHEELGCSMDDDDVDEMRGHRY